MRLMFVCTGNLCRSPVAERLAKAMARDRLGSAAEALDISSAGLDAPVGREMDARSARALIRLGGDPSGFRARRWTPTMGADADLVLTMTRRQRRVVLEGSPKLLRRTYTLLEAADLLARTDLVGMESVMLRERARLLAQRLDAGRAQRSVSEYDDVPDPIGRSARVHEAVAMTIAEALTPLASALFRGAVADDDDRQEPAERRAL